MPTRDQVVQVPFVGSIDEYTDPDQLKPPGMQNLVNCVVRKAGRIEKREGFVYLQDLGAPTEPAKPFGGAATVMPTEHEALGTHSGQDGSKLLLASNNTLFEYVGTDPAHGFREVNRIPSCVGTLRPVTTSGGEVIEVESMLDDTGAYRCTAWVLGVRNGQDMTNDTAVSNQPDNTDGIYVSLQNEADGSFVIPPTRIGASILLRQVCDLRMCKVRTDVTTSNRSFVIAWRTAYVGVQACVVDMVTVALQPIASLVSPATWQTNARFHRSFDVVGVPGQPRLVLAYCEPAAAGVSSDVNLATFSINGGGAFTQIATLSNLMATVNAVGTAGAYSWDNFASRGVVLEADPQSASDIRVAIRATYFTTAATPVLDGKMVLTRFGVSVGSPDVITATFDDFAWMHRVGFQTDDNMVQFVSTVSTLAYSRSARSVQEFVNPAPGTTTGWVYGSPIITGQFFDGSVQAYVGLVRDSNGRTFKINSVLDDGLFQFNLPFPSVAHGYPSNGVADITAPVAAGTPLVAGQVQINKQQITRITSPGPVFVNAALADQEVYARLQVGGVTWAYAILKFDNTGTYQRGIIYNGLPGNPAAASPGSFAVSDFDVGTTPAGPWTTNYVCAAGNFAVHDDLNTTASYTGGSVAIDYADQTRPVLQTSFDSALPPEACVHRWDVKNVSGDSVFAFSSTSAGTSSSPNGDNPLGYASPFAQNNFFEVYLWDGTARKDLNDYNGGNTQTLVTAIGGPWRMLSSLCERDGRLYCVITPSGDDYQRSAFLVSFEIPATLVVMGTPKPTSFGGGIVFSEGFRYVENPGLFVESVNMPRTGGIPLNVPRMLNSTGAMTVGMVRQSATGAAGDVFSTAYDFDAHKWRSIKQWSDYSVINGGVVSSFDGESCSEVSMLMWPQRDMTSIAYERVPTRLYTPAGDKTLAGAAPFSYALTFDAGAGDILGPLLWNIKRPWFAYEAGFKNAYGQTVENSPDVMYWSLVATRWGGQFDKSYETVYSDPRTLQVSSVGKLGGSTGLVDAAPQHYYGRYQIGSLVKAFVNAKYTTICSWAPRATSLDVDTGASPAQLAFFEDECKYEPTVANGDFLSRWCYEAVDATGRIMRSAPSIATTFTVCFTGYAKSASLTTDLMDGGNVEEYRYGFFVPRMELTNRLKTAETDARRTVLQPYFTAEPFSTVFYKVPYTNFLPQMQTSFTVPRNATRGVVPFSSQAATGVGQLGLVTNNLKCFDGPQRDYNGLLTQPVLYTVGGGLDNVPPPSALCMTVHQNRLVLGGADDATVVWFSKELSPVDAPGFNDALTIQIEDGGAVTGLASLESILVVFKRNMTWLVPGDMPDDTGANINRGYISNALGTPIRMPHGIGCIDHRSVIETPVGVFFRSERTIELLAKDMSITPIGLKLDDTLTQRSEVCAALHNAKDTEVWFALRIPGSTQPPFFVVYNYQAGVWSKHTVNTTDVSGFTLPMTIMEGSVHFASTWDGGGSQPQQTVVYRQVESQFFDVAPNGKYYVQMFWRTAPISLNEVQGFQRLKRLRVFGSPIPTLSTGAAQVREPHGASFTIQTDYATSGANDGDQVATWTEAESTAVYGVQNREVYEIHLREQKGQAVTLQYTETPPSDVASLAHGYGTAFSNMAFVVGLKDGLDKRITPGAKH